jgi:hypothetical protein
LYVSQAGPGTIKNFTVTRKGFDVMMTTRHAEGVTHTSSEALGGLTNWPAETVEVVVRPSWTFLYFCKSKEWVAPAYASNPEFGRTH